jgi:ATP-binding cassette subfamily B multidrug efflux pump
MKSYRLLFPYFRNNLGGLSIGVTALLVVDLLQLFIPLVIKRAVDDLTRFQATSGRLLTYAGVVMALALAIAAFRFVWRRYLLGHSRQIEEGLRNRLFAHLQTLSYSYFDRASTGDLMAHATNDVQAVQLAAGMGLVALTDTLVLGTAAVGFMLYINPLLTVMALLPMPFVALFTRMFSRLFHERFQAVQASFAQLTERARENLAGIRAVKAYAQEVSETARFDRSGRDYVGENLRMAKVGGLFSPMSLLLSNLSMALILVVGGRLTMVNIISAGDFVAFNSYLLLLTWPMMALGWMINLFQRGAASLARIERIIDTAAEVADGRKTDADGAPHGVIECRGLTFAYPGATWSVLRDLRLRIESGQFVGVVGRTGAGKSTFLKLIPRLYEVADGQLYLDGKELHCWPLGRLRGAIAMVPQEPFIFADSVRANICFGRPDASEDELVRAVDAAQLLAEIRALPRQFDTLLGERGVSLSGGQKQRLTLARALLLDRPLLILDDCLSSVDVETEVAILGRLRHYLKGRTTLMASQRLEPMRTADIIFVLDRGELRESGTHDELLAANGTYAVLYRRQQLEAELKSRTGRG